jgi:hypothetical protein
MGYADIMDERHIMITPPLKSVLAAGPVPHEGPASAKATFHRMDFFNEQVKFKPDPLFRASAFSRETRPLINFLNRVYTLIGRSLWVYQKVDRIVNSLALLTGHAPSHKRLNRRLLVTSLIAMMMSTKDGLGFKPTARNTARGTLMLFHLLSIAGLRPQPVAVVGMKNHFCIRLAINPAKPSQAIAIDISLMVDRTITSDSVIDYYDGDIVKLETRPISVEALRRAYLRERAIDLPAPRR